MVLNLFDNPEFFLSFYDLSTLVLLQKRFTHFFVAKTIYAPFLSQKEFTRTFFCRKNNLLTFFVAKTIYALSPESFCALKVAIRKVQTFWASEGLVGILFKTGGRFTFFGCIF